MNEKIVTTQKEKELLDVNLRELYKQADYKDKNGMLFNADCMDVMEKMENESVNFTLTDIPYNAVNRDSNGLRNLDKGNADIITFNLDEFLKRVLRVTSNSICIFCGKEQFSQIYKFFADIGKGTVRPVIWEKTNPSPMNGQYIYLSGVEMAVWYKNKERRHLMHGVKILCFIILMVGASYTLLRRTMLCLKI